MSGRRVTLGIKRAVGMGPRKTADPLDPRGQPWLLSESRLNSYFQHYGSIITSTKYPNSQLFFPLLEKVESARNDPILKDIPIPIQAKSVWYFSLKGYRSPKEAISSGGVVLESGRVAHQSSIAVRRRARDLNWTCPEAELDAYYEYYGSIIKANPPAERIVAMVEAIDRAREDAALKEIPVVMQARRVAYLARERLHSAQQAISSGRVKVAELKTYRRNDVKEEKAATSSTVTKQGPYLREWWNETLGEENVNRMLTEIQSWLRKNESVQKFVITRPDEFWNQKDHWTSDKYYPRKAEYYVFTQAVEILKDCIFDFFDRNLPLYLLKNQLESSEDQSITDWLECLREKIADGSIPRTRLQGSFAQYRELLVEIRLMRNQVQHMGLEQEGPKSWIELAKRMNAAVNLAKFLGDTRRVGMLEQLLDELNQGPALQNYLKERHRGLRREEVEMGVLEKFLVVLLQDFRAKRVLFQDDCYRERIRSKNAFSIAIRERALRIRAPDSEPEKPLILDTTGPWSRPKPVNVDRNEHGNAETKTSENPPKKEPSLEEKALKIRADESKQGTSEATEVGKPRLVQTLQEAAQLSEEDNKVSGQHLADESKQGTSKAAPTIKPRPVLIPQFNAARKSEDKVQRPFLYIADEDEALWKAIEQEYPARYGPGGDSLHNDAATKEKPNDEDLDFAQDTLDADNFSTRRLR